MANSDFPDASEVFGDYWLFLDDWRSVEDVYPNELGAGPNVKGWRKAKSFEDFKRTIERYGVPKLVSFDHDLGFGKEDAENEPSGMACAKWLVDQGIVLEDFRVHSANQVGAENIHSYLTQWKKHNEENN